MRPSSATSTKRRNRAAAIVALTGCLLGSIKSSTAVAGDAPDLVSTAEAAAVKSALLADWERRRTRLVPAEMEWKLFSQLRSASYPAARLSDVVSKQKDSRDSMRVSISPDGLRLQGSCAPALQFGRTFLPEDSDWASRGSHDRFKAVLNSQFSEQQNRLISPLPYLITLDKDRETHSWTSAPTKSRSGTPVVVKLPVGTAGPLLFFDSTKVPRIPWMWGLVEPLRLGVRPDLLIRADTLTAQATILPLRPVVLGKPCIAVEYPIPKILKDGICRLWLDPSRDHVVRQAQFLGESKLAKGPKTLLAQYNLDYRREASGDWLPDRITTVQYNGFGDPYDELHAGRTELRIASDSSSISQEPKLTAGTLVIDRVAGEQFRVRADGTRQPVPFSETVAELYADTELLEVTASTWTDQAVDLSLELVTWPGVLITLPLVFVLTLAARATVRRLRSKSRPADLANSTESGQNQSLLLTGEGPASDSLAPDLTPQENAPR